jgi:transposase
MLPDQVRVVMEAMGSYWITLATQRIHFTACDTVEALTAYAELAPMLRQLGTSVWYRPSITP